MRYLRAIPLALATFCVVGPIAAGPASAASITAPPPVVAPPGGAALKQAPDGTWTMSAYLDTAALCDDTFDLVTSAPDTDKSDPAPAYTDTSTGTSTTTAPCGPGQPAVTEVELTFPALPDGAIPQTATLVVTPSAASLAAGATPVEFALTVRRQLSGASSLWTPVWFGAGFVVLLVAGVMIGGAKDAGGVRRRGWRPGFWRATLYAPSAWTFGGAWATNFTALGTVIGGVLAATGAVAGIVPGVDLSRIGLLFAVFGAFAVIAPLVFATLNTHFSDTTTAGENGEIGATKMWIMLAASSFTAFGMGASLGLVGWVLTYRLVVAPATVRWCIGVGIIAVAALFLVDAGLSIIAMADRSQDSTAPRGEAAAAATPAAPAPRVVRSSFLL